jgi:hypothetical protein
LPVITAIRIGYARCSSSTSTPNGGGLDGDVAQILADLDALRDRVVELQRRLAEPSIGVFSTTATGQR